MRGGPALCSASPALPCSKLGVRRGLALRSAFPAQPGLKQGLRRGPALSALLPSVARLKAGRTQGPCSVLCALLLFLSYTKSFTMNWLEILWCPRNAARCAPSYGKGTARLRVGYTWLRLGYVTIAARLRQGTARLRVGHSEVATIAHRGPAVTARVQQRYS